MSPNLHIIVSCTDRKRAPIPDELRLRAVPMIDLEGRANLWTRRLITFAGRSLPTLDLYGGDHWTIVRSLPTLAQMMGFDAKLWVISAGYGLVPANTALYPYSATFARSHQDSVTAALVNGTNRKEALQAWWEFLCRFTGLTIAEPRSFEALSQKYPNDYFLIIASPGYMFAVEKDLIKASMNLANPKRLIIISSRSNIINSPLGDYYVAADARLQTLVGGACGSLNARIASMVLKNTKLRDFSVEVVRSRLEDLISRSPKLPKYERDRMEDKVILSFIRNSLNRSKQSSCTALLRELRTSGRACEQSRFKKLYMQIKESDHEA